MTDAHNEIAVIGSLLIEPERLDEIASQVTPEDFESPKCRSAIRAALYLRDAGQTVDAVTINEQMCRSGEGDNTGWLLECIEVTPSAKSASAYCRLVRQGANRRRLLQIASDIGDGVAQHADWQEIARSTLEQLEGIEDAGESGALSGGQLAEVWGAYCTDVLKDPGQAFCPTGYGALDGKLGGGMFRQGMYIVGARPGMGKTTLGVSIAENIAQSGRGVLMASLEMSGVQMMAKRIARETGLCYTRLMNGGLPPAGRKEAERAAERLSHRPFYLLDQSRLTAAGIERAARQIGGLRAVVIDYLGLVRPAPSDEGKPRYEAMTALSAELKGMARRLGMPVLVLCQLNRESTGSADRRPQLQHLRDTGAIEQDADAVILLHRPEYYAARGDGSGPVPEREIIELIVAKNRHGETGTVKMSWRGSSGEICQLDAADGEPLMTAAP